MDFTGFNMQDHYQAVVQERERQITEGRWRRRLGEARRTNEASCCATDAGAHDTRGIPAARAMPGTP